MATSKNNDTAAPAAAVPSSTAAKTASASTPSAAAEPVTQAAASAASTPGTTSTRTSAPSLPPTPSDYEMPDDYETDPLDQARTWVEQNPALAVVAAAGIGLVVGRIVMALLPDPEPTFAQRVEKRAGELRKTAAHYADDAGDTLSVQLKKAADALGAASASIADTAEVGYEKSKDLADVVSDAVKAAVAGAFTKKADSWMARLRR